MLTLHVALGAVIAVNLALVWGSSILPGQDLPQHLAYARILEGYGDASLPFAQYYDLPERAQSFFSTYYILAALARLTSIVTAGRIVFSAYVVGMVAAFAALASAIDARQRGTWTALLAALVVWNPVVWMGFLPFLLAMPLVLAGYAALLRRRPAVVFACAALVASLHVVAAACFVLLAALHAIVVRSRDGLRLAAATIFGAASVSLAWTLAGESGFGGGARLFSQFLSAHEGGLDELTWIFHIDWGSPLRKIDYALLAFVGTLATRAKIVVAAAAASLAAIAWSARGGDRASTPTRTTCRRTLLAFWAVCGVIPAAVQLPSDISFFDYRVIALAAVLTLALVDGRAFEPARARLALFAFVALVTGLWARTMVGVAREGDEISRLVERLDARAVLLALPLHDGSDFIDPGNTITHYWPMMHTVLNGGITSQFWGRFTAHLPVGYKPGRDVPRPDDRRPWEVTREHVRAATHVLVSYPDADEDEHILEGARRAREILTREAEPVACEGRNCLYRVADN